MKLHTSGDSLHHSAPRAAPANPWNISADDFPADGAPEEKLWFALQYAVLAPSTHNTQPWHFHIKESGLGLYADMRRALPVVDPVARELTISCGAALAQVRIALEYFSHSAPVQLLPDPTRSDWLAQLELGMHCETNSDTILLFQSIPLRRTNRHKFSADPLPEALPAALQAVVESEEGTWVQFIDSDEQRVAVADLVAEADRQQWGDRHFRQELASWIRPQDSPQRDGLPVATQELGKVLSHAAPFAIRTFDLGKGVAAKDREIVAYSPLLAVIGTATDEPAAWLRAGQSLARFLLRAEAEQVSASFLNQPLEVPDLRLRLAELVPHDGIPQLLVRLGRSHGERIPPTPRRSVKEVLI